MNIAIIGAGAAGMACAYYLNKAGHHVTIFEKQAILGGNIRTLGKNVELSSLPKNTYLEAGVVEFPDQFHHFIALMKELGVRLIPVDSGTAMFFANGKRVLSPRMIELNTSGLERWRAKLEMLSVSVASWGLATRMRKLSKEDFYDRSMGAFLKPGRTGHDWIRNLCMYSYSIPFEDIQQFPAEIGIPAMRDYMMSQWYRIDGGVYTYVEKILEQFNGEVLTGVEIQSILRTGGVVEIDTGSTRAFDKVVFACPPDQVLKLLADPTADERRRFGNWKGNHPRVLIHIDTSFYSSYDIKRPSAFDFFETPSGWGYNAYLNELCGIESDTSYGLAFNLQDLIAEDKVIHVQEHHVPFYRTDAVRFRDEIIATNGESNTFHAGAYLGDGLHEGAVGSAVRVAELVGALHAREIKH